MSLEVLLESLIGGTLVLLVSAVAALIAVVAAIIHLTAAILGFAADLVRSMFFPTEKEKLAREGKPSLVEGIYYWLHPDKLRLKREKEEELRLEKEADEVGKLLHEYEDLLLEREELEEEVKDAASDLRNFAMFIGQSLDRDAFAKRAQGEGARRRFESFDTGRLRDYDEVKELAEDLEATTLRIFAIKQELRLYGINKGEDNG
jgi:hypothetical protein